MTPCDTCIKGVKNFVEVSPALWRGAQPTSGGFCNLKARGVKTIINLRHDHDDFPLLSGTNFNYLWIPARAWHPEEEDLVKFLKVLKDEKNWPVFVHCAAGSDRTGYSVATYRIVEQNWTADDAIHEMFDFKYHPWWFRNPRFLRDKIEEERECIVKKVEQAPPPQLVKAEGMCPK
jgi:tyrosine-protein phosphatase SIW14